MENSRQELRDFDFDPREVEMISSEENIHDDIPLSDDDGTIILSNVEVSSY